MKGKESTLAAQFDLTSSEIKDCACKEGSQGTFFFFFFRAGDQNFFTLLLKNRILLVQPLQTPVAKPATVSHIQN